MSNDSNSFTDESTRRISSAVRYVERLQMAGVPADENRRSSDDVVRQFRVGAPQTGAGKYVVTLLKLPTADLVLTGALAEADLGTTHTPLTGFSYVGLNPFEIDGTGHALRNGAACPGVFHRRQGDKKIFVVLIAQPDGLAFHVKLTRTGGDAGGAASNCSFTYDIHPVGDTSIVLASAQAPRRARWSNIEYEHAGDGEGANEGIAAFNGSSVVLLDVLTERAKLGCE